jgi:hypothetical protein
MFESEDVTSIRGASVYCSEAQAAAERGYVDQDEEAGLRAFALRVGCYAGASYPERPQWVERDGLRVDVEAIESQWREEERLGFRLRLADASRLLVYYVPEFDLWSGVPMRAGAAHPPDEA